MFKPISLFFLLALGLSLSAQDLSTRIPANTAAVVRINADQLFKLMDVAEFQQSVIGKQLLKLTEDHFDVGTNDLSSLRIDLHGSMYIYSESTDSITYSVVLIPLTSADGLDALITSENVMLQREGNKRLLRTNDLQTWYAWNDQMLTIITGTPTYGYFNSDEMLARLGLERPVYDYSDEVEMAVDTAVAVDTAWIAPPVEEVEAEADTLLTDEPENMEGEYTEETDPYTVFSQKLDSVKTGMAHQWTYAKASELLEKNPMGSVVSNPSFKKAMQSNSLADAWVPEFSSLYGSLMPYYLSQGSSMMQSGLFTMDAHLLADQKEATLMTNVEVNNTYADAYRKITSKKFPKKLLQYVPSDKAIGFLSYSVNTKAYLDLLPTLLKDSWSTALIGGNGEEGALVGELFSLLLDEEAVSKVIKGDALFVLTDISSKEVTYTDYTYDDNFNATAVEKTKMEQLPEFMVLLSSDDTRLIRKLLEYGMSKGDIEMEEGLYKMKAHDFPLGLYFSLSNGLVAIGTNQQDILSVQQGKSLGSISSFHKKLLKDNWFSGWFSPEKMAEKFEQTNMEESSVPPDMQKLMKSVGDVQIHYGKMKGNTMSGAITMAVPNGQQNGLIYLIDLISRIAEM